MSHEKRMKDLMARLVAMSPEPPPYPEDDPVTRLETRRRPRPALVFAAAAALVIALAIPLLLFTGEEAPPAATSTTTTLATDSTTTTNVPVGETWSGVIFLYQSPENSNLTNPALVPVALTIDGPFAEDVDFSRALSAALQAGKELPPGLDTAIPDDVIVQSTRVDGETIVADMNQAFLDGTGGLLADFTMLNQLVYTLTYGNEDGEVLFTVAGEPVTAFGGDGIDLTEPLDRETYLDDQQLQLHVINLTSPIVEQDGRYLLEGIANVFEATVQFEVVDAQGEPVHEDFITVACGTGCWGQFSTEIPAEMVVPGETSIRIFVGSPRDGSDSEVITVPIPEDGVWTMTVGG
jgi:spore germination protein GerM